MKYTVKKIRTKTMTPEKKKSAKNDFFAFYIGRPISYYLTIPFLYMKVSPNTISFLSLIPSLLGFLCLGFGNTQMIRIIGVLLFLLWNFFDGVDGNIARYTNKTSQLGVLWDAASGYFAMILMYLAVGLAAFQQQEPLFDFSFQPYIFIVLGSITSLSTLYSRLVMHKKMLLFPEDKKAELNDKENYSFFKIIALNITSPSGFMQVILLLSVIAKMENVFIISYFFVQLMICIVSCIQLLHD